MKSKQRDFGLSGGYCGTLAKALRADLKVARYSVGIRKTRAGASLYLALEARNRLLD